MWIYWRRKKRMDWMDALYVGLVWWWCAVVVW
jgi:hypothetical protein